MQGDDARKNRTTIRIDGGEYASPEEMPPEVRSRYEETLAALEEGEVKRALAGGGAGPGGSGVVRRGRTRIRVDGEEVDLSELPPGLRLAVEKRLGGGARPGSGLKPRKVRTGTTELEPRHEGYREGRQHRSNDGRRHGPTWVNLLILAVSAAIIAAIAYFA